MAMPTWILLLFHLYEAITLPVYLRVIFVLFTNKQFSRQPFWRIFRLLAILDLFGFALLLFLYRFPMTPKLNLLYASLPAARWIAWANFAIFAVMYQQNFLHFVICLNRFTGVFAPFSHERFWKRTLHFWLLLSLCIAIVLPLNRFFAVGQFQPLVINNSTVGFILGLAKYDFYYAQQELVSVLYLSACGFVCLALNSITLWQLIRLKRGQTGQQLSAGAGGDRTLELSLFFITLWTMVIQIFYDGIELLTYLLVFANLPNQNLAANLDFLYSQIPWVSDFNALTSPWVALILSAELRAAAFSRLFKNAEFVSSSGVANQQQQLSTPVIILRHH